MITLRDEVWASDGEGLILKRCSAPYQIGKRSKDFIKIKALRSEIMTVIGFVPSHGLINNRGLYATIVVQDSDGIVTTVKTRNDLECRLLEREGPQILEWRETRYMGKPMKMIINHPAIGRKLRIEYQEKTFPDNNYRHPRFDHWVI
jgi:ATP-dependent DNA ligase